MSECGTQPLSHSRLTPGAFGPLPGVLHSALRLHTKVLGDSQGSFTFCFVTAVMSWVPCTHCPKSN